MAGEDSKKPDRRVSDERRYGSGTRNDWNRRLDKSEWIALEKRRNGDRRDVTPRRQTKDRRDGD